MLGFGAVYQEGDCCDATPPCGCKPSDTMCMCPALYQMGIWHNGQCTPLGSKITPGMPQLLSLPKCNDPTPTTCVSCIMPGPGCCGYQYPTQTTGNIPLPPTSGWAAIPERAIIVIAVAAIALVLLS